MARQPHLTAIAAMLCLTSLVTCAAPAAEDPTAPLYGDWQGTIRGPDGAARPICAQVICWGRRGYQANLLDAFDQRAKPLAVLKGQVIDGGVVFGDTARIAGGVFQGRLEGRRQGEFTMERVVRLSPALGAEPPAGAVVLFDGSDLNAWQSGGEQPWVVNLGKILGGNERVAYLRCRIACPTAQDAVLEIGSDDGVKAWLNGRQVHGNLVPRPVRPWEDRVEIELQEGWNQVLLKIQQGRGGWGACARIRSRDGADIDGLRFDPAPRVPEGADLRALQGESAGTILAWELAGPYTVEGKRGADLFDLAFPPEQPGAAGVEWQVVNDRPESPRQWKLVEGGAVEVTPGAGARFTTRQFRDLKLHIEFRTPFKPDSRGQGRGNSGVFVQGYEVQVLDSYGLEGRDNECGAIYHVAAPRVNACAPPLQWQTYDIEFHAARYNDEKKAVDAATMTVYHNGILIHDNVALPNRGGGGPGFVASGPILLQDHGNRVRYRNIWVVEP